MENGTVTVIYAVAEQRDGMKQLTNNNMKLDSCRIHKNLKAGKHQLGSIYTLKKKSILQIFIAVQDPVKTHLVLTCNLYPDYLDLLMALCFHTWYISVLFTSNLSTMRVDQLD